MACAWACVAFVASFWTVAETAAPENGLDGPARRVLVVHSYNPEYVWTRHITQGIRDALAGVTADIDVVYLAPSAGPTRPRCARPRPGSGPHRGRGPRVVVAVDDAAQAYLVEPFLKGRPSPQVVFCGSTPP
jgi:hypothetical protein